MFECVTDGIEVTDLNGVITEVNESTVHMHGFDSVDEVIGKSAFDLISRRDYERARANISKVLEGGTVKSVEYTFLRADGSEFPGELCAGLLTDVSGNPIGFIEVLRDITERKRLQKQLVQAQKMEVVGQLAGGIAHDFNNLLTPILGYANMSVGALPHEHRVHGYLSEIETAAKRATSLTRQLLTFSRRQVNEVRVLNLNDLIANVDRMLWRIIGEDIELAFLPSTDNGMVKVDAGQTEQVLANVAVNARDAMPEGGKLTLWTASVTLDEKSAGQFADLAPGRYVKLSISDTGIGMNDEVKSHVFEPFYTTKGVGEGTGLGLATCYGIVKDSGGEIRIQSEPGRGTTVEIYLPSVEEEAAQRVEDSDSAGLPRGTETVLLAEDEPSVRGLMAQVLRGQGYTVLEATNGEQALRLAQTDAPQIDLLLSDVVMPRMGGKALAAALQDSFPVIKVLFTTGYTEDVLMRQETMVARSKLIPKPFTQMDLARKVREVLDAP